jgi:poly(3-hydroxybutyrate) depolymerase
MAERGREGGFDGVKDVREHLRAFSWACLKKNRRRLR